MTLEHVDVLIIGAGISGISAAHHVQTHCPSKTFAILEARSTIGGTWDLFRYPGVRSDSDMYTLSFAFNPWKERQAIASGEQIHRYLNDSLQTLNLGNKLRLSCKVLAADWNEEKSQWLVTHALGQLSCKVLMMCAGYYRYTQGYTPAFKGVEQFAGTLVHPQHWPSELTYANKKVVVIGSGATAVTLVPALAQTAAHVVMLQRSPSYFLARPSSDVVAQALKTLLPLRAASTLTRWKNVLMGMYLFHASRSTPERVKSYLLAQVKKQLPGFANFEKHFTPAYAPWTQRLCLVPDGDFFQALSSGKATIVTDHIESFTPRGITLASGQTLEADIVVMATGLQLEVAGGIDMRINGKPIKFANTLSYKGLMFSGVPNLISVMGYLNASWTLKADLVSSYLCRLLQHMDKSGTAVFTPTLHGPETPEPPVDFSSGYFQRAMHMLPKQGGQAPWRMPQSYLKDLMALRFGKLEDGVLLFTTNEHRAKIV